MLPPVFVFDVESIGLHGEAFAVAGGVFGPDGAEAGSEFCFAIPRESARGREDDRAWVNEHVPEIPVTHPDACALRSAFWKEWLKARERKLSMLAWCHWPVETNFLSACVADDPETRRWQGPFPFHDLATLLLLRGRDSTDQPGLPDEIRHDPSADARKAARNWFAHISASPGN